MNLSRILAEARVLLDSPRVQHPSMLQLVTIATQQVQQFHNELQNTSVPWNINSTILSVGPNVDEYLLAAPDFGKVRYILTEDTAANFLPREVRIADPENFDHFGAGVRMPFITDKHNAIAMAFYGQYGSPQGRYVKVTPVPRVAADYRIFYDVGPYSPGGLGEDLIMPEFHHLLVSRVVLAALPYAQWEGLEPVENVDKRARLGDTIQQSNQLFEDAFERYRTNQRQEQMAPRMLYGEEEMTY